VIANKVASGKLECFSILQTWTFNTFQHRFLILFLLLFSTAQVIAIGKSVDYNDFFSLMGKGTPHWSHLSKENELAFLNQMKSLYDKNKEAQFSTASSHKIPPIFHLIWLGPKPFPPESVENLRSWIAYHPQWKFKFWTDRSREPPCTGIEMVDISTIAMGNLERCLHSSSNWAEKSDLLRYQILFVEGGVYVDHDAYCIASFDSLARGYDFFCCLETPHEPFANATVTCWNGLIGSCPKHPVLAKVIDLIDSRWELIGEKFRGKDLYSQVEVVMQRTYIAFTDALEGTLDWPIHTDIVFPAAYFFAKSGITSIYSKHFCQTTWDLFKTRQSELEKFGEKSLTKIGRKNKRILFCLGGISLLTSLFLLLFIRSRAVTK